MIMVVSRRDRALEGLAWLGLVCGTVACASLVARGPRTVYIHAAGASPEQFTAWVQAICAAIGALTAAANGLAIAIHRGVGRLGAAGTAADIQTARNPAILASSGRGRRR